jgi:hypothetical protein
MYFVILEFLKENLEWRGPHLKSKEDRFKIKDECIMNPEERLWVQTRHMVEVRNMFNHISSLQWKSRPNYDLI